MRKRIREISLVCSVASLLSEIRSIRVMCTRPLSILRQDTIKGKYFDVVPCGRCPECLQRKQGEFACLATLEAKAATSVHFLTFTYANHAVPIMLSREDEGVIPSFVGKSERLSAVSNCSLHDGRLFCATDGTYNWTPSLCRFDFREFLKYSREAYAKKYGHLPDFRYAGFGEYG